jgi:hypothetical protein
LVGSTFGGWQFGAASVAFSTAIIIGFLTPVIGALVFIGGILFLILSPGEANPVFLIYLVILSFVMILLGPGSYSIDAKLFGRREIILSKKN